MARNSSRGAKLTNVLASADCAVLSAYARWLVVVNASSVICEKQGRCCMPCVMTRGCDARLGGSVWPCTGAIAMAELVSGMTGRSDVMQMEDCSDCMSAMKGGRCVL
jgi:hypothetical protein